MELETFLESERKKDLLRFSTAGSVDDGKSTLIGRLLHDSQSILEDQLEAIKHTKGNAGDEIDWALLTDGLKAEREQGITIDVAYRYFSTPKRKFIIADTPGHEQYTRNMATGASTADLAIVLIDARNGVLEQSKRHAFIASLLQIPHIIVAVNKMDLVDYSREVFEDIRESFSQFAAKLRVADLRFLPISALRGDNVVNRSERMGWYTGEPLLDLLETVYIASDRNLVDLRFPVQYVLRPNQDFRGYCGQIASGILRPGSEIMVLPSMITSRVREVLTYQGPTDEAFPPMSVTVRLEDEIDISRGDMLVNLNNRPQVGRHFEAMVVWMDESPLDPHTSYFLKHGARTTRAQVGEVRYRVDVTSLSRVESATLAVNEIGRLVILTRHDLMFDAYERNRATGSFILIDPVTNRTAAAGMIIDREPTDQLPAKMSSGFETTKAHPALLQSLVSPEDRQHRLGHRPATVWITGLVASGKTETAYRLEKKLFERGVLSSVLHGGNMRQHISVELAFSSMDIAEHLRRVAETARVLNQAGIIAICSFVSPMESLREGVRELVGDECFIEIFADAPQAWCESRDRTGLYARARAGELANLAGVNSPYEEPEHPDLHLAMDQLDLDVAVERILDLLSARGIIPA